MRSIVRIALTFDRPRSRRLTLATRIRTSLRHAGKNRGWLDSLQSVRWSAARTGYIVFEGACTAGARSDGGFSVASFRGGSRESDPVRDPREDLVERLARVRVLRSDGRRSPRKTRFPATGPAPPGGIVYPQDFDERLHILR